MIRIEATFDEKGGIEMWKHGGQRVKGGTYWSLSNGEFITIPEEYGVLPGGSELRYLRGPLPMVMVVGPLLGLAYIIFLPLVGFITLFVTVLGRLLVRGARAVGRATLQVVTEGWSPAVAYFSRRRPRPEAPRVEEEEAMGLEGPLGEMEEEIRQRREQGER